MKKPDLVGIEIHNHRRQYGVGQGGFHVQSVACKVGAGIRSKPFRFVYDCGVRTREIGTKAIKWAIDHAATRTDDTESRASRVRVDALFLSHFDQDHISHIATLAEKTEILRVVLPHINRMQALTLILKALVTTGAVSVEYASALIDVADGKPFLGLPTTRVSGGQVPPNTGSEAVGPEPATPPSATLGDGADFGGPPLGEVNSSVRVAFAKPIEADMHHSTPLRLVARDAESLSFSSRREAVFWQLRTWVYAESSSICDDLCSILTTRLAGHPFLRLLTASVTHHDIAKALKDLKRNKVLVAKAYEDALRKNGVPSASDHNIVSLCLYSGPMLGKTSLQRYNSLSESSWSRLHRFWNPSAVGWIGAGDALLGRSKIWADFHAHMNDVLCKTSTVLAPHHGSSRGGNLQVELYCKIPVVIFSAGAQNQFHHPNQETLEVVLESGAQAITVTELSRPGFFEYLLLDGTVDAYGAS